MNRRTLIKRLLFSASTLLTLQYPLAAFAKNDITEILQLFQALMEQPCTTYEEIVEGVRYAICVGESEGGDSTVFSASSSLVDYGDGLGYWLTPDGDIYAIQLFHIGETFFFDPVSGQLIGKSVYPDKMTMDLTEEERHHLEGLIQDTSSLEEIFDVFMTTGTGK